MSAPSIPPDLIRRVREVYSRCRSKRRTAAACGVSEGTVYKHVQDIDAANREVVLAMPTLAPAPAESGPTFALPDAAGDEPGLPDAIDEGGYPIHYEDPGRWLVLSDVHIPFHSNPVIRSAVDEAVSRGVDHVLLNGDLADCFQVSDHQRDPDLAAFEVEIEKVSQFLRWLRHRLPDARIVWREGNHENRLRRYIVAKASELRHLKCLHLPELAGLSGVGGEWHQDKRILWLGKLAVLHGHELRGGGGVNVGRWLYLQVGGTALMGHLHRTSEHHEPSISGRLHGCWSAGCACSLTPQYLRINKWNSGYAFVVVHAGGDFEVVNRRVLPNGQVV